MTAHISIGDTAAIATLLTLFVGSVGGFILGYLKLRKVHDQVNTVNGKVEDVQQSLRLPSNPDKTIAAEMEGVSQSFHFLARMFDEIARGRRKEDGP